MQAVNQARRASAHSSTSSSRSIVSTLKSSSNSSSSVRISSIHAASSKRRLVVMAAGGKPTLMVNSCTGKMGVAVAEAAARAGIEIVPFTLCGDDGRAGTKIDVAGVQMELVGPAQRDEVIERIKQQHPDLVVVDYTVPGAHFPLPAIHICSGCLCVRVRAVAFRCRVFGLIGYLSPCVELCCVVLSADGDATHKFKHQYKKPNTEVIMDMAALYLRHRTPFVMGTTGGDRAKLVADAEAAGVYAVIAPQMGKQVVAFQAAMEMLGENFPGAFSGYSLRVVESHQSTKRDTSGTAKAIVASFGRLGVDFDADRIEMVRDRASQVADMKVPEGHLDGHAFHTYRLASPDGTVGFEFQHNVCGRAIYAEGTVDAALFLARQVGSKADKKVYNMIDVLRAGAMR